MKNNDNEFLCVVDVQRGYQDSIEDQIYDYVEKINNTNQRIFFFFVGTELCLDSKDDVVYYLLEHGLDESKVEEIRFVEKTYGFFRSWMDLGVSDEIVVNAIKTMMRENINDSRDFSDFNLLEVTNGDSEKDFELKEKLLENPIFMPDFDISLFNKEYINGIELIGGGRNECLKEIELLFKAMNKEFEVNEDLCYGGEVKSYKKKKKQKFV